MAKQRKKIIRKRRALLSHVKHIAVVYTPDSQRRLGDVAAFVDVDKNEAIKGALMANATWNPTGEKGYQILVGTLTEEAVSPVQYKLKKL